MVLKFVYRAIASKFSSVLENAYIRRESRYASCFLRRKNATGGTDGERKLASIRKVRRSLVDSLTELRQIAIEGTVIERSQFDLDGPGIACDGTRKLEERE